MMSVFASDRQTQLIPPHKVACASTLFLGLVTSTALSALGCSAPSFTHLAAASLGAAACGKVFEHLINAKRSA